MGDVVLHVGLHKTGTTFLQQAIFPKLQNVNYIHIGGKPVLIEEFLSIEIQENMINLISGERLSGKPYIIPNDHQDRYRIADRLKKLFPQAKIIVGVRNTEDWYRSLYKQYCKMRGTANRLYFDEHFDDGYLDNKGYVAYLREIFPDVYVYHYEHLNENSQRFVEGICDFIGTETPAFENKIYNKSMTEGQLNLIAAMHNMGEKVYKGVKWLIEMQNRRKTK